MNSPPADIENRRDSILAINKILLTARDELALCPGTVLENKVEHAISFALSTIKGFEIKRIPKGSLDYQLDLKPLATTHSLGQQILALWDLQKKLRNDIRCFEYRVNLLQVSLGGDGNEIRTAIAEAHDFMVFTHFTNEMLVEAKLTAVTLSHFNLRNNSGFVEGAQTLDLLKSAYSIRKKLASEYEADSDISNPIILSKITLQVIREWYKNREMYMEPNEQAIRISCQYPLIPIDPLLLWYSNARRRAISETRAIRSTFKVIVDNVVTAQAQFTTAQKEQDNDRKEGQSIEELIQALLLEVAETAVLFPPQFFDHPPVPESKSPLYATYWVSSQIDPCIQEIQRLLKAIYMSFGTVARTALRAILDTHWECWEDQWAYTVEAKTDFETRYLHAIKIFMSTFRLKEAAGCAPDGKNASPKTGVSPTNSTGSTSKKTEIRTDGIKTGRKRTADTSDDIKSSKALRVFEPEKEPEGDTFPTRLCNAMFYSFGELSSAEKEYLMDITCLSNYR